MSHELLCSMTIPCSWRVGLMKKLIEIILNDQVAKEENPNILELIDLLSHSNEREFTAFLNEFEDIGKRLSLEKIDKTQELLEFICIEVDKSKKEGKLSKTNTEPDTELKKTTSNKNDLLTTNTSMNSSYMNSPEKQSGSRWTVSRDERRKILEQMERAREEQKRRKKKEWCRLEQVNEFDEWWEDEDFQKGLKEIDLENMKIDEGISIVVKGPEIKRTRITPEIQEMRSGQATTPTPAQLKLEITTEPAVFTIVDFDCIENLLFYISRSNSELSNSAKFILNVAEDIYKSDLMFYIDLRDFDQPFFMYYAEEDDLRQLRSYNFEADDLGRFCRSKSFIDKSRKFYRERAFRHRYISWKPYNLFFTDSILKRLREEMEFLEKRSKEFHFWITEIFSKRNLIFVSGNSLLKAFALLLVLSRTVEMSTKEIADSIWSHSKFGVEWTLMEILKKSAKPLFFTTEIYSKLSHEAKRLKLKFV